LAQLFNVLIDEPERLDQIIDVIHVTADDIRDFSPQILLLDSQKQRLRSGQIGRRQLQLQ
jgi:hypothetical protein